MNEVLPAEISRFVDAAKIPVSIALPGAPDRVLIAANRRFRQIIGFEEGEILGRDCRFLQGEATDPAATGAMRRFFEDPAATQTRVSVVNYRKDGRPFINLVFLSKLYGADGELRFLLASQFDISRATRASAEAYDRGLGAGLAGLNTLGRTHQLGVETSLASLASSTHAIASARLALAEIEARAS